MPLNFDDTVFNTLAEAMDEMFPEIRDVFFQETESSIQEIETEIASNNLLKICGIAHKIKSSAKTFGANGLVVILEKIEDSSVFNATLLKSLHQNLFDEYVLMKKHIEAKSLT